MTEGENRPKDPRPVHVQIQELIRKKVPFPVSWRRPSERQAEALGENPPPADLGPPKMDGEVPVYKE